jgi:transcription antitermination factor NusG
MVKRGRVRRQYDILAVPKQSNCGMTITGEVRTYSRAREIFLCNVRNVRNHFASHLALSKQSPIKTALHKQSRDTRMSEPRWFAAYVRSRHESRVAQHLEKRDVELFFPQYTSQRRWSDRKVNLPMPLFPGYLFVRIQLCNRMQVLTTPGVLHLVGASGRPEPLEDAEIELMKAAVMKCNDPRPHDFIRVGDRVTVIRGALEGHEGFLVRDKSNHRIVLSMDLIQRSMSVEVDLDDVVPAENGSDRHFARVGVSA